MTDMKWTTIKRDRKDPASKKQRVPEKEDLPASKSAIGRKTAEIVQKKNGYVRRPIPKSSVDPNTLTEEQQQQIETLYLKLASIAQHVMEAKRSDKETHEHALEEIRSLLDRIIVIDPSRYETPLGHAVEDAIIKIYTVVTK